MERIEVWKNIDEYGNYKVSSFGNIKSFKYKNPKNLKQCNYGSGYLAVCLCRKNIKKSMLIHRLVAIAFIYNPLNKPQVNHKDGNKHNNDVNNLEWCTPSENQLHAVSIGIKGITKGEKNHKSKLKNKEILEIRNSNLTQEQLGIIYGVARTTIQSIKNRRNWKHI